jgi:hypothetical protein
VTSFTYQNIEDAPRFGPPQESCDKTNDVVVDGVASDTVNYFSHLFA